MVHLYGASELNHIISIWLPLLLLTRYKYKKELLQCSCLVGLKVLSDVPYSMFLLPQPFLQVSIKSRQKFQSDSQKSLTIHSIGRAKTRKTNFEIKFNVCRLSLTTPHNFNILKVTSSSCFGNSHVPLFRFWKAEGQSLGNSPKTFLIIGRICFSYVKLNDNQQFAGLVGSILCRYERIR